MPGKLAGVAGVTQGGDDEHPGGYVDLADLFGGRCMALLVKDHGLESCSVRPGDHVVIDLVDRKADARHRDDLVVIRVTDADGSGRSYFARYSVDGKLVRLSSPAPPGMYPAAMCRVTGVAIGVIRRI